MFEGEEVVLGKFESLDAENAAGVDAVVESPSDEPLCENQAHSRLQAAVYELDLGGEAGAIVDADPGAEISVSAPREVWEALHRAAEECGASK